MKIAQPYRCDGPGCKKLREDDTNNWWLVGALGSDLANAVVDHRTAVSPLGGF